MGRVIRLRQESWVTRVWWALWRWMRPPLPPRSLRAHLRAVPPASPAPASRMTEQLLASQRRVVDELKRLQGILARTAAPPAERPPRPRGNVHPFRRPKLKPAE